MATEKKPNPLTEVLKKAQQNLKVAPAITAKVQQAKFKNKVASNKPTKRSAGRGG
jgi:hypothetical protein